MAVGGAELIEVEQSQPGPKAAVAVDARDVAGGEKFVQVFGGGEARREDLRLHRCGSLQRFRMGRVIQQLDGNGPRGIVRQIGEVDAEGIYSGVREAAQSHGANSAVQAGGGSASTLRKRPRRANSLTAASIHSSHA